MCTVCPVAPRDDVDMTVVLRPLARGDLDAVMALEPELFGAGAWSRAVYQSEIERADRYYVAATSGGALVGYAGVALEPEWNVMTVGVAPEARRQGIGAALVAELIAKASMAGGGELFLEVRASDDGAQSLYRNAGFEPLGVRKNYYQAEGEDAVVMRRVLRGRGLGPIGSEAAHGR